jgi:hypothetical protein
MDDWVEVSTKAVYGFITLLVPGLVPRVIVARACAGPFHEPTVDVGHGV